VILQGGENMTYIAVGMGGVVGSLLRYSLGLLIEETAPGIFPLATLLANVTGSFLLTFLTMYVFRIGMLNPRWATALGTGLIGSFTTFSTFSVETVHLLQAGKAGIAAFYVISSLAGGLLAARLGFEAGDALFRRFSKGKETV